MPVPADIIKQIKSDKVLKIYELINQCVDEKFYGSITIKMQAGEITYCEQNKSISLT